MLGALALLFLLAATLAIVRVAGVALQLTGLPQPVARFQAISAQTGTGFTTSEAEGTMHHLVRRRILTLLMFAGHLGVVSLASTVILAMGSVEGNYGIFLQLCALLAAVVAICFLASSTSLDAAMCGWVARVMKRSGWLDTLPYELLYEAPNGFQLCDHFVRADTETNAPLLIVGHNGAPVGQGERPTLKTGDRVTIYADAHAQASWANVLPPKEPTL